LGRQSWREFLLPYGSSLEHAPRPEAPWASFFCINASRGFWLFTFVVADRKISHVIGNEKDPLDQTRRNQALAFAEAEARKTGCH
jgi:hypothetical protein